jgi:ADP-L-glycero-D-manno-heptose 6-epimerase
VTFATSQAWVDSVGHVWTKENYVMLKTEYVRKEKYRILGKKTSGLAVGGIHHFTKQMKETGTVRLFAGSGGYGDGEQQRGFVYVRDLTRLNMFFAQIGPYAPAAGKGGTLYRGVVNAGSGVSRTFNDVAKALMAVHGQAAIEYVPFPADLEGRYQHFTEAALTGLRQLGCDLQPTAFEKGIVETYASLRTIGE